MAITTRLPSRSQIVIWAEVFDSPEHHFQVAKEQAALAAF
jgi:hypothetical protein